MDQPWYQDFVSDEKMDRDMLFNMLSAANFLGIKPLLDLTCLKVTFQITGKNAEEVRRLLYLLEKILFASETDVRFVVIRRSESYCAFQS